MAKKLNIIQPSGHTAASPWRFLNLSQKTFLRKSVLPILADFVGADDNPGQVQAEEEHDDAEGDVGHVQLAVVLVVALAFR